MQQIYYGAQAMSDKHLDPTLSDSQVAALTTAAQNAVEAMSEAVEAMSEFVNGFARQAMQIVFPTRRGNIESQDGGFTWTVELDKYQRHAAYRAYALRLNVGRAKKVSWRRLNRKQRNQACFDFLFGN